MDCHNEHHHHHGHDHNDDDHIAPPNTNEAQTLYPYIDLPNVRALNESEDGTAAKIVRPYEERLSEDPILYSDVDEELIVIIPFTGLVKLHSILLRSLGDESSPSDVRVFKNRPDLEFGSVEDAKPVQVLNFPQHIGGGVTTSEGNDGIVQFAVNRPHFTNITSLTLHIPANYGADRSALTYIGLRGEWSELRREPVIAQYEAAANPADYKHRLKDLEQHSHQID